MIRTSTPAPPPPPTPPPQPTPPPPAPHPPPPLPLRVVPRHRCGDYERPGSHHMPRIVAPPDLHPQGCQIGGAGGVVITAGDRGALLPGEERQAAHARSGDPHEVDRAGIHRGKQVH